MIYYWVHILYIYIGAKFFWNKVDLVTNLSRERTVSILDCDAMRYMANSKYFYYMDFIRFEIIFRTKLYDNTFRKGVFPVLGSQKFVYKKPLKRWTKFRVTLILEGWDDKWVYHRHTFEQNGEIRAIGFTKIAFWKNKKAQDMRKIIYDSGLHQAEMNPSINILNMFNDDYQILKNIKPLKTTHNTR
ncbi:acyl-CoA thioesterase [Maribacter antarcticus]|uniref:acyl-CoA thioesterase n=1 Tax=Maribacter antarcticus TaxID=505250 RepID=UPI00047955DA|nr:acyl-CoA thioesterase [Maribacter antarcticus]